LKFPFVGERENLRTSDGHEAFRNALLSSLAPRHSTLLRYLARRRKPWLLCIQMRSDRDGVATTTERAAKIILLQDRIERVGIVVEMQNQVPAERFPLNEPSTATGGEALSGRKNRQDYFGMGAANASTYFDIPTHIAGGTGPNQGRFGTLGRNTFRGPAYYSYDFALIKDTPFGRRASGAERMDLQFRGEFFRHFAADSIVTQAYLLIEIPSHLIPQDRCSTISIRFVHSIVRTGDYDALVLTWP
jgi:hypothetical protein